MKKVTAQLHSISASTLDAFHAVFATIQELQIHHVERWK